MSLLWEAPAELHSKKDATFRTEFNFRLAPPYTKYKKSCFSWCDVMTPDITVNIFIWLKIVYKKG